MPFDGTQRQEASTEEIHHAYDMLVRLEQFFDCGKRWHRGELCDGHGKYCLIGAINHLRGHDIMLRYLVRVAWARHTRGPFGNPVLAAMNDDCRDFAELRDCLREARALAAADLG